MKPAILLISFAKSRRKAYKAYEMLDFEKEKAVKRILEVCQFFLYSEKKGWINQIRQEISILMPSEDSEKAHWRDKINQLLN